MALHDANYSTSSTWSFGCFPKLTPKALYAKTYEAAGCRPYHSGIATETYEEKGRRGTRGMGEGAPCSFTPRRRAVLWRGLGLGRRRKLQVAWLGSGGGGGGRGRCRGLLRRLRLPWLRRTVRKLAAIYMAALTGPPASCPAWVGVEPCFATPFVFVPNARPFFL